MGNERPGQRPGRLRQQHRSLHLDVAALVELVAQLGDNRRPGPGNPLGIFVDDQVDIALARPLLDVDHSVPFIGKGPQGLGKRRQRGNPDAELTLLGGDDVSGSPDPVAQVEIDECAIVAGSREDASASSWMRPVLSRMVAKASLPNERCSRTLPATVTPTSVDFGGPEVRETTLQVRRPVRPLEPIGDEIGTVFGEPVSSRIVWARCIGHFAREEWWVVGCEFRTSEDTRIGLTTHHAPLTTRFWHKPRLGRSGLGRVRGL